MRQLFIPHTENLSTLSSPLAKTKDGAAEGTRTPTGFRPPAPKAGASANSATTARADFSSIPVLLPRRRSSVPARRKIQIRLPPARGFARLRLRQQSRPHQETLHATLHQVRSEHCR